MRLMGDIRVFTSHIFADADCPIRASTFALSLN